MARLRNTGPKTKKAESYRHPEADLAARPEIGAQAHFKRAKPPSTYRFDSSLAPELCWDGENPARETAEHLISELTDQASRIAELAKQPASPARDQELVTRKSQIVNLQTRLRKISGPFLNWSGKAERLSFDVPTLPLFVHERLSTSAILETLKGHKRDKQDDFLDALHGFQERSLTKAGRLGVSGSTLRYKRFIDDFPVKDISNFWTDTSTGSFTESKVYVVQTSTKVIERCLLMTTDPGDLVLDPTCGSGTTAFVAEQWGRRWITCDTSRVPLALARQCLLTATFDYYQVNPGHAAAKAPEDWRTPKASPPATRPEERASVLECGSPLPLSGDALPNSPANGFVYKRRQNQKGEEVGGIVPHITLKSIANNEPPAEEVLVDRPEVLRNVVRVTGPFSFEATIPTAEGLDTEPETPGIQGEPHEHYVQRMLEVLRRAPVLRLLGNQTVTLKNIRPPAKTLTLSAEALVAQASPPASSAGVSARSSQRAAGTPPEPAGGDACATADSPIAILFGPENGPLSGRLVREAWDEAGLKHYSHLYVIGFAIDPKARQFIDSAGQIGIPCTYLQATMDLQMGDLLKNMRSSQIFSVCGLPDVAVRPVAADVSRRTSPSKSQRGLTSAATSDQQWQAELLGLDTFDPITMEADHLKAADVPAWLLDTDYNGMVFRVRQAFFPRTGAWENLKKSLRVEFEDTVWDHLAGTTSAPFPVGEHGQIAVKVIDPRGNELLVVKKLEEAR